MIVLFYIGKETSDSPAVHLLIIENSEIDIYSVDYYDNEIETNNSVYHFA